MRIISLSSEPKIARHPLDEQGLKYRDAMLSQANHDNNGASQSPVKNRKP